MLVRQDNGTKTTNALDSNSCSRSRFSIQKLDSKVESEKNNLSRPLRHRFDVLDLVDRPNRLQVATAEILEIVKCALNSLNKNVIVS